MLLRIVCSLVVLVSQARCFSPPYALASVPRIQEIMEEWDQKDEKEKKVEVLKLIPKLLSELQRNKVFAVYFMSVYACMLASHSGDNNRNSDLHDAIHFVEEANDKHWRVYHAYALADWAYNTDVSEENYKKQNEESRKLTEFEMEYAEKADRYPWQTYKNRNATLFRWFKLMVMKLRNVEKHLRFRADNHYHDEGILDAKEMSQVYVKAKMCPYSKQNCSDEEKLPYDPDVRDLMHEPKDPEELRYYWVKLREMTGKRIRKTFIKEISSMNQYAQSMGYSDYAEKSMAEYEDHELKEQLATVISRIFPLYQNIHAYVRKKLMVAYKSEGIKSDGPIPVHILGDMSAQIWVTIFHHIQPFPNKSAPNVTHSMLNKNMKPADMFKIAEGFFTSLGFDKLPESFWKHSVMERSTKKGKEMMCHPTANDLYYGNDFRIRMCAKVNQDDLRTIHHEMGHTQYQMHFAHLPIVFRNSANPGFHEAIGDSVTLSAGTPEYLEKIGLLNKNETGDDMEYDISYLLFVALQYMVSCPYSYIIDYWRNQVYQGAIKPEEMNRKYWEYRLQFQGVCPPVPRTEEDFDPGAKFHVIIGMEYTRYFFSNVLQFQIHKALCNEAGHKGPLFKCNLYNNKVAGKLYSEILAMGRSRHWHEVLGHLTHGQSWKLEADAMLEFFEPLYDWLRKENQGEYIGWKSENPMKCP